MEPSAIQALGERVRGRPGAKEGRMALLSGNDRQFKVEAVGGSGEEVVREGDDLVIISRTVAMIGSARKGISTIRGAWAMDEDKIVISKGENVMRDTASNFLGGTPMEEVLVVCDDCDGVDGAHEEMVPMLKAANNGEKLSIINGVVALSRGEGG
jgi:hypothetical protein